MDTFEKFYEDYWKKRIQDYGDRPSKVAEVRSKFILKLLNNERVSGKVLDVGCGNGTTLIILKKNYDFEMYGVEISPSAARIAVSCGIEVKVADITKEIPYSDGFFDLMICSEVLEHLPIPESALEEIKRVARKGALFIFTVPNTGFFKNRLKLLLGKSPFEQGRYSSNEHLHFWTAQSFKGFLESHGFRVIKMRGVDGKWYGSMGQYYASLLSDTLMVKAVLR